MHGFVTALEWATTPATVTGQSGNWLSYRDGQYLIAK